MTKYLHCILRFSKHLLPLAMFAALCLLYPLKVTAAVIPDGVYLIQMSDSDMTVAATSDAKGSRLILWPYRPTATWGFKHLGNDIYKINTNSMVLDSREGIKKVGVPIIIWPWHGAGNQRWKVKRIGNNYSLINVTTGLAVELKGNKRVKNNVFQGNYPNGSAGQLFKLVPPGKRNPSGESQRKPGKGGHFINF